MSEKGCGIDEVVKCVKKAKELAQYFYVELLGDKIEDIRFEGFNTRNKDVYTVDLSFVYPTSDDELGKLLGKSQRVYRRFSFGRYTMNLVSMEDL